MVFSSLLIETWNFFAADDITLSEGCAGGGGTKTVRLPNRIGYDQ